MCPSQVAWKRGNGGVDAEEHYLAALLCEVQQGATPLCTPRQSRQTSGETWGGGFTPRPGLLFVPGVAQQDAATSRIGSVILDCLSRF